jgi:hypothetical protein
VIRLIYLAFLSFFISLNALAENSFEPLLNTIDLEFSAEQWVTTQSALVTVGVNATVSGGGLEKAQSNIMTKLAQISNKGEWHITVFNRSLNQSGLEQVQISAQARIPSSDLSGLRDRAKAVTKPGETYTLDNIEFTPSETELRDATTNLRSLIYQQAKNELASLTKFYPDQHYFIHRIDFTSKSIPQPMNAMYMKSSGSNNISVGNKLVLTATAILAAAPNLEVSKIVHS